MANYGLKIGTKEFTRFTHPVTNRYGLAGNGKELDVSKLKVILREFTVDQKFKPDKIPENWYLVLENGLYIDDSPNADWTNPVEPKVRGKVIEVGQYKEPTDEYGIKVQNATLSTKDVVLMENTNLNITQGKNYHLYGHIVNMRKFIDSLIDFSFNVINMDGDIAVDGVDRNGERYIWVNAEIDGAIGNHHSSFDVTVLHKLK